MSEMDSVIEFLRCMKICVEESASHIKNMENRGEKWIPFTPAEYLTIGSIIVFKMNFEKAEK